MNDFLARVLVLVIAVLFGLSTPNANADSVAPLALSEVIKGSDAIVVGTITGKQSRWGNAAHSWMQTDYTLDVEDVVYPSELGIPIPKSITLTYWGGTIGGETQAVADVRLPAGGERLVLMLHSQWTQGTAIAPTMGFNLGFFSVEADAGSGKLVVRDAASQALTLTSAGQIVSGAVNGPVAAGGTVMDLTMFTGLLRANIGFIKATPVPVKPKVDVSDPRIMKIVPNSPGPTGSTAVPIGATGIAPVQGGLGGVSGGVPAVVSADQTTSTLATSEVETLARRPTGATSPPNWSTNHQAHLPIVVNQFTPAMGAWYQEDQYQMSKWNSYAADVFHVYLAGGTGTYAWGDGVFDMSGWMNDAQRQATYGSTWYCGSGCTGLAVTFMRYDGGGWIIEADIALNSGVSWTLDDEWVFDGSPAIGFRQSMIHELGHMHGLNHNFGGVALMNYFEPGNYRYYAFPFMDDAAGIRGEYPANAVAQTDLAAYLFHENGICYDGTTFYNCISEASYPASVLAGGSLTVNNYHVENVGTTVISTPTIEWYLTSARNFTSSYYYLGTSTYSSLPPFNYFTPSTVGRTLTVPAGVPPGSYYLAAFIRGDGGPGQGSFPFSNNKAFSLNQITVTVTFPSAPIIVSIAAGPGRATISFGPPTSNGGAPIVSYTATCTAPSQTTRTATGTGSPLVVYGLTAGVVYSCTVRAYNGTYSSSASSTLSVTPGLMIDITPILMLLLLD